MIDQPFNGSGARGGNSSCLFKCQVWGFKGNPIGIHHHELGICAHLRRKVAAKYLIPYFDLDYSRTYGLYHPGDIETRSVGEFDREKLLRVA